MIVRPKLDHAKFRRKNYMPIEDQIDAIVKCIEHLAKQGIDVGADIAPIIEHRQAVKNKFPKL